MKKSFFLILTVVFISLISVFILHLSKNFVKNNKSDNMMNIELNKEKELSEDISESELSDTNDSLELEDENSDEKENVLNNDSIIKEEIKKDENIQIKDEIKTPTVNKNNSTNESAKNDKNQNNDIKTDDKPVEEHKKNDSNQEENNTTVIEIDTEIMSPTDDEEYKKLKKIYRYETSSECFIASNEAYDLYMDDEKFFVTTCETKSYNGNLVGWGVIIYFNDNTFKYYEATN